MNFQWLLIRRLRELRSKSVWLSSFTRCGLCCRLKDDSLPRLSQVNCVRTFDVDETWLLSVTTKILGENGSEKEITVTKDDGGCCCVL